MMIKTIGPIYGVILPECLPTGMSGQVQYFPGGSDLKQVCDSGGSQTVAALEVAVGYWRKLNEAIERSGFDLSPCMQCGEAVVCIPDGLAMCLKCVEKCAEKAGGE